ncbi:MAG: hypothetical protein ABIZ81_11495 [Opitutaceae bacterium]
MSSGRGEGFTAQLAASDFSAPQARELNAAHQAVHAAMEVSERFTTASQRAVNLQFSVKGEELSVRVEMQDGQVRTTFRTASAELHTALAQEWQVLAASNAARGQRFADPVFSGGASDFNQADNGGNPENQRGHAADRSRENFGAAVRSVVRGGPAAVDAVTVPTRPVAPLTALRLHTFA